MTKSVIYSSQGTLEVDKEAFLERWWELSEETFMSFYKEYRRIGLAMIYYLERQNQSLFSKILKEVS